MVIEGVKNPEKNVPKLKTRSGEPYDAQVVEDDVKMLLKSRKFVDVSPRVQPLNGGVVVIFQIVERPTIKYIKIVGCENTLKSSLESKTDLKVKDGLDPYAIKEARDKLETYYHEHGYDRVRVMIAEGLNPGDQGVVFLIDEGRKQKIWQTNFIGNKFISGDRLATQIMSNPPLLQSKYLWGGFKGEADRKKIEEDVEKLTAYYRAFGFFQAKVGRFWSFDEKENWMYLTFVIDEGPQYKVRSISFIGNRTFPTPKLSADLKLHANDFFNQGAMNKDLGTVRDVYGSYGFVFADIQADPRLLEDSAQLDLVYSVKEGSRYRVGQINISITGESPHTSYVTILDRLSLRPGDILDTTKLRKDERRLGGSGLYETKDPNKKPKIVFSPPPGMEDATKQLASRPEGRAGWRGGSGSSGGNNSSGSGSNGSGSGSSSTPFGPTFGSGDSSSGPAGSGSSNFRGQAPDDDGVPTETIDVNFVGEPLHPSPAQLAQPPRKPVQGVEWIDPLEETPEGPAAAPAKQANPDDESQGPIIRGQAPAGGYNPGATGPDSAASLPYGPAPQNFGPTQVAQVQPPYNPYVNVPTNAAPAYGQAPSPYQQQPAAGYASPPVGYPQNAYPPGTYPQYSPTPPAGQAVPQQFNAPLPGTPIPGGHVGYYQIPGQGPAQGPGVVEQVAPGQPVYGEGPDGLPYLKINPQAVETQTGKLSIGVGVNSDAGLVGSIVIDEQNFDPFRYPSGWEDFRNGTAFRGGGDQLRIELAPGTEVQNYVISLRNPYLLDTPVSFTNSASYYERYYDNWTDTRVSGSSGLGYYFTPDLMGNIGAVIERVKISAPTVPTPPEVNNALGWSFEGGVTTGFSHDTRDNAFMPGAGHLIRYSFEYLWGRFDYPVQKIDLRQYFTLGERPDGSGKQVLGVGLTTGFAGNQTPVFDTFYAGGFSSLRGFAFRGVSPLDEGVAVGGDFEFLGTVEYNMPVTADDVVRAVAFVDFGTVEASVDHIDGKDIRVAPGVGLRIQIPALGAAPIALDLAFPLNKLPGDQGQLFSFSLGVAR